MNLFTLINVGFKLRDVNALQSGVGKVSILNFYECVSFSIQVMPEHLDPEKRDRLLFNAKKRF